MGAARHSSGFGRASTSRCAKLRSAWTGSSRSAVPSLSRDAGRSVCRLSSRQSFFPRSLPIVSRDSRRGALRTLSATSHRHEGFLGPLNGSQPADRYRPIPSVRRREDRPKLHVQAEPSISRRVWSKRRIRSTISMDPASAHHNGRSAGGCQQSLIPRRCAHRCDRRAMTCSRAPVSASITGSAY